MEKHVKFILERCGIDAEAYLGHLRYHNDFDFGGMQLSHNDGHNCGPIACMVL